MNEWVYIWTDKLSRWQLDIDGQISSDITVGRYGHGGQMDVKVGQIWSDSVWIWMDEQIYLNGLGRYGQTGLVDIGRYVGSYGQTGWIDLRKLDIWTGRCRQTSKQIWTNWLDMDGWAGQI